MNNPADDAAAAGTHEQLDQGHQQGAESTDGRPVGDPPQKRKRGRPPLPPGQKGKYKRKPRSEREAAPAKRSPVPKPDAAAAGDTAPKRKAQRGLNGGWLRVGGWGAQGGRTPTVLRDKAREVLAELGYPELANIITDPEAKDADKLRAVDILMKASVGYMTPEQAMGEDAPELPAPIFTTTTGPLPGDDDAVTEEDDSGSPDAETTLPGESTGTPSDGVLKFPPVDTEYTEPSGPIPYSGGA